MPSEPRFRRACGWLLALAVAAPATGGAMASPAAADPSGPPTIEQVKAAYLVNFLRYTDWPPERFAGEDSPYVVCLVGAEAVADELEAIAGRVRAIEGRPLEVRRYRSSEPGTAAYRELIEALDAAHVVYVGSEVSDPVPLLRDLDRRPILTVGERPEFAAEGGMIGLRREGDRVVFDANPAVIRTTPILVSARVLRLAHIVERSMP